MTVETLQDDTSSLPFAERLNIPLKRRSLTVVASVRLTPHMQRVTLTGEDLADFQSPGFDDNVKLLLSADDEDPIRRSYTPRSFDVATRELVLDFALHDAGPATQWALSAEVGSSLVVGGPRGSRVVRGNFINWLLIGDETALPAIGRKVEEAGEADRITVIAGIPTPEDQQAFETPADVTCHWLCRTEEHAADPAPFLAAVKALDIAPETFIWIAAEAQVAQTLKSYVLDDLGVNPAWIKSSGYWTKGHAGK
ncbi:siderophore-interacting protein [Roseibium sp. CAU 1637]|uniref:Siderophore-interacting protein n=1 Tax=Roseibium limicola TaxID=2816037 RepID=A0A939EQR5_9HYPH|nr:siderophore-interacting protein [Roseibium limicola]MBO0346857.1 siderophore-interacting protein [Roseibium limicola]